jgi:hypothetical protein
MMTGLQEREVRQRWADFRRGREWWKHPERGGFQVPGQAFNYQSLLLATRPKSPEALPWVLFHTKTYTDNSTRDLDFFDAIETDKSLGNMEQAGTLPEGQFFRVYQIGMDVLREVTTSSGGVTGAVDDVMRLVLTGRGYWTLTQASKVVQGPFPLSFLHGSGGVVGFTAGTWTAEENISWATNSHPDGGWSVGGMILIRPRESFGLSIKWPAAIDLTADARLRVWMSGVLFRPVK